MIACTAEKLMITGVFVIKCQFFPHFCFFCVSELRLPATSGFVGEFFVILAAVKQDIVIGLFAALTLILGAGYSLLLVKKFFTGKFQTIT